MDDRAQLKGKAALVIGGGGGIGRAVSLDLARAGARVALCDIDPEALAATAGDVRAEGELLLAEIADACDPASIDRVFAAFDALSPHLDILVNVAGGTRFGMFADSTVEDWERDAKWNYLYVLQSCRLAIPRMRAAGGGAIVSVTTIEAHRAAPGYSVYAGYKAALTNFSRSLAVELGREGIRVNTVALESVPTASQAKIRTNFHWKDPSRAEELTRAGFEMYVPMGRTGAHQELSNAVLFLASELSSFITGTTVHVDGGAWASSGWTRWPGDGWYFPRPSPSALERMFPASE
ncbi:SDR family NAD(P)-dependent oxidoreductase [Flavisphingomonas formosensis]|uniref:SDR family NAD(P)-dependent oxidoreductase n=1 Tax=Flavisphingomonas formosensis TaxID=861534 RepID=UPI0012F999DF|nr:SDR family oxidoreductase [Sphingomonas formosensis]